MTDPNHWYNIYFYIYYYIKEPQKPDDALTYLKKAVQGSEDKATIEQQKAEIERLNKKVNSNEIAVFIKTK